MPVVKVLLLWSLCFFLSACGDQSSTEADESVPAQTAGEHVSGPDTEPPTENTSTPGGAGRFKVSEQLGIDLLERSRMGDLDAMEKARVIRVLTVYGPGRYFLDGPLEKGPTYEMFKMFEQFINKGLGKGHLQVHVLFIPVSRDELIPALIEGRGDIAAAGLTITAERDQLIDFSAPVSKKISEILVTGPSASPIKTIEDLAGQKIYVRASSSYRSSLDELNRQFHEDGRTKIQLQDASEMLEDEDILEMVNAGLIPWAVVDDYKARIWEKIFKNIVARDDIVFRQEGRIAFAVREDSPNLKSALDEFLKTHRQGTLTGNILFNRYFRDFDWANNALEADNYKRFLEVAEIFSKYGDQYGFDYLMVAAQGYQESRLDQSARNPSGAIGIMQMLPSTAKDKNVGIPDITTADANIHAGIKYLDFIRKRYFADPEIDRFNKTLFAFASYNAGPARIRKLRDKAEKAGYDPNVWFDHVEVFAAREIGRETVQYVANILKYYIAYSLSAEQEMKREQARKQSGVG
jgi:membrane-bound lytic murein transglycosylase MltF